MKAYSAINNMDVFDHYPKKNRAAAFSVLILVLVLFSACLKENVFPASGTPNDYIALVDVRNIFKGEAVTLNSSNMAGASKITGVVISDAAEGNIPRGILVIQQTSRTITRGIEINVGNADVAFKPGDSVRVSVEGASMNRVNGILQINASGVSAVEKIAENIRIVPAQVSLSALDLTFSNYESTLVKVAHVDGLSASKTLAGEVQLSDVTGKTGVLHTEITAVFATQEVPVNASYVGIARYNNSAAISETAQPRKELWPVRGADISEQSGALYPGFPEDFEHPDATLAAAAGYSTKSGTFATGAYTLTNVAIGKDANDYPVSGVTALRLNQNSTSSSWTAMDYDLPNGATKVTIWAGSYGASADLGSTWRLEYSQNQGLTWSQVGNDILTVSKTKEQFTFLMDIRGAVRFRVGKLGIGASSTNNQNGRFSMDDLAVYKNPGVGGGPVTNPVPAYETVTGWQFGTPATAGSEVTLNATTNNANLTTGVLSRGAGLGVSALVRSYASNAAGTTIPLTKELALSQNTYYQVRVAVKAGYKLSLSAIDTKIRRSAAGAKSFRWYYSLDGVNFKETSGTGDINYEGTATEGQDMPTYYLYNTPELQNIPSGTTVTLRMYAWGFANLNSGSFSIGRTAAGTTTNALSLGGRLIPE